MALSPLLKKGQFCEANAALGIGTGFWQGERNTPQKGELAFLARERPPNRKLLGGGVNKTPATAMSRKAWNSQ
jgi:hypothetical protein